MSDLIRLINEMSNNTKFIHNSFMLQEVIGDQEITFFEDFAIVALIQ